MQPAPCFSSYRPLIDNEDAEWFSANETEARDNCPPKTFRRWAEQAAWLTILQAFDDHPTLEELAFDADDSDPDRYVFVQTRHVQDEEFKGLGEDPGGLDEELQSYINDMGRNQFAAFHARLAEAGATREALDEEGEELLGSDWVAQRRQVVLDRELPAGSSTPAPKPRV